MRTLVDSLLEQTYMNYRASSENEEGEEEEGEEEEGEEGEEDEERESPLTHTFDKKKTPNNVETYFELSVHVYRPFVKLKTNFSPPRVSMEIVRKVLTQIWPNIRTDSLTIFYNHFYGSDSMPEPDNWSIHDSDFLELDEFYNIITTSLRGLNNRVINTTAGNYKLEYIVQNEIKKIRIGEVGKMLSF